MESLVIAKSDTTPAISFDIEEMLFSIEGECRPENVLTFFEPVLKWIDEVVKAFEQNKFIKKSLDFHFKLEYYNSSSAKFIFEFFKRLKKIQLTGIEVTMFWFYDVLDEDLLECGQEYEKILGLPFKYVTLQD